MCALAQILRHLRPAHEPPGDTTTLAPLLPPRCRFAGRDEEDRLALSSPTPSVLWVLNTSSSAAPPRLLPFPDPPRPALPPASSLPLDGAAAPELPKSADECPLDESVAMGPLEICAGEAGR